MELTVRNIEKAKPGDILRDPSLSGFYLKVSANGKSFFLYYRTKDHVQRRPKIGEYPILTIANARDIAKRMLLEVANGGDPMRDREEGRRAPKVDALCDRYLAEYAVTKKSKAEDARMVGFIKASPLAKERVRDVRHTDVAAFHLNLAGTPYQANRFLALLSKMFNLAELWQLRPQGTNPCRFVRRYPEKARRRKMSTQEALAIAAELRNHATTAPQSVAFIHLLILSGARKSEIAAIQPEWLDGNVLNLPDSKTGQRAIYLPPQAMAILDTLPRVKGQTLLGIKDPTKLWQAVRAAAGCPDLRLHDLRRTFASAALSLGFSLAQVGELLGHASTQTTKGYAYLMPEPALMAAEAVAGKLEEMMSGGAEARSQSGVVPQEHDQPAG